MADKILAFQIDVQGASTEAKEIAKIEIELSKLNEERKEANKLAKQGKITAKEQADALAKITSRTIKLRQEKAKLLKTEKENNRAMDKSAKSTNTFRKAITSFLFKANFMANVMSNLVSKVTQFATQAIRAGIKGVISFDAAITDVRAVAQATEEQFEDLRESAIELGRATKFTATQVALLQKEYAKLGFTTEDIIQLQESTLKLATATGGDLATAAKVVGGALRSFNKDTREAAKVSATLAIATTKSALTFDDYETILSTVAPVANAYNFSLEDTLALLGQLKNANFDASKAATATRNILLNLADANGALAQSLGGNVGTVEELVEGLITLRDKGVDLATTLELTDKRSVAAFNTFLQGAENVTVLKGEITDVNQELDDMVNIQLSSLENKLVLLSSAFQGLIQEVSDNNDAVGKSGGVISTVTGALQLTSKGLDKAGEGTKFVRREVIEATPVLGTFAKAWNIVSRAIGIANKATDEQTDEIKEQSRVIQEGGINKYKVDVVKLSLAQQELAKELAKPKALLAEINKEIKDLQELQLAATTREQIQEYAREIKILQDRKKELTTVIDQEKELKEIRETTLKAIREAIKLRQFFDQEEVSDSDFFTSMELTDAEIDEALESAEELANGLKVIAEDLATFQQEGLDEEEKEILRIAKLKLKLEQQFNKEKQALGNNTVEILSTINDRALEQNEAQLKQGLISEEEFALESLKLRQRQARFDKAQALFNIGINTKVAVSKITAEAALLSPLLIPGIIANGILQAIGVALAPIPQFADSGVVPSGHELPSSTAKGDNTLVLAKPGEVVLNKDHQAALGGADTFRKIGVPGFADSGVVPSIAPPQPVGAIDVSLMAAMIAKAVNDKQVVLNVNELNSANDDLTVINQTNQL